GALDSLADDAVEHAILLEIELHLHLGLSLMDQVVVALCASGTPQRPRDRIEDRGFSRAIGAGQAGERDTVEAQGIGHAIGQKVLQLKADRDHFRWIISEYY